jgi:glycolate oxidase iron-sulfur subunit
MTKFELFEYLKDYATYNAIICAKCGQCRVLCPIYESTGKEFSTARAKVSLIEMSIFTNYIPGERFYEIMSQCTTCMGCREKCTNDVRMDLIIALGRFIWSERRGSTSLPLFFEVLKNSRRLGFLLKILRPFQNLFLNHNSPRLKKLFKRTYVPRIEKKFLREEFNEIIVKAEKERGRVIFFPGCFLDFFFPEIGTSVIKLLTSFGISVVLPKNWSCCGIPAIGFGELMSAYRMAAINAEILERIGGDLIITACGSCGATLKDHAPLLFGWKDKKIEETGKRVKDIMEFIYSDDEFKKIRDMNSNHIRAFYHPSCHLKRGMGVHKEAVEVLKYLKNIELKEMEEKCCGFGGSFNIRWYDFSVEIGERRINAIKDDPPDYLLTGSPGCMMQFRDIISREKIKIEVTHPVVLMWREIEKELK